MMAFVSSQTFWYLENRAYCDFNNENITIYLKKTDWAQKCKSYLDAIYQLALKKYREISQIRTYISQWEDIYYRNAVLEQKKTEFLKLVNYRTQIQKAIQEFETAFFDKYHDLLQEPMERYYSDLETEYYILMNKQDSSIKKDSQEYSLKLMNYEQQMWNVNHVLQATCLDEIMEIVPNYIYLKQRLLWK